MAPLLAREAIGVKSKAAAGLCEWAVNIVKYFDVFSEVSQLTTSAHTSTYYFRLVVWGLGLCPTRWESQEKI